ncbi:hypothetical protein [Micromonospora haikouensis]|uniref:hypothetical protein n=1 Tax=Micromonospora haikouensis TaxID=686309 RepID=UPI0037AFD26F
MRQCRDLVGELVHTGLLTRAGPGRFRSHDLIHAYARELCHEQDAEPVRRAARRRLHRRHSRHLDDTVGAPALRGR